LPVRCRHLTLWPSAVQPKTLLPASRKAIDTIVEQVFLDDLAAVDRMPGKVSDQGGKPRLTVVNPPAPCGVVETVLVHPADNRFIVLTSLWFYFSPRTDAGLWWVFCYTVVLGTLVAPDSVIITGKLWSTPAKFTSNGLRPSLTGTVPMAV
jgi:hypothetical protein